MLPLSIHLHDRVKTPLGCGLAQGILRQPGQPDRLLVSHKQADISPELWAERNPHRGPFILIAHDLGEVWKL
jgi:hypothetical protein